MAALLPWFPESKDLVAGIVVAPPLGMIGSEEFMVLCSPDSLRSKTMYDSRILVRVRIGFTTLYLKALVLRGGGYHIFQWALKLERLTLF